MKSIHISNLGIPSHQSYLAPAGVDAQGFINYDESLYDSLTSQLIGADADTAWKLSQQWERASCRNPLNCEDGASRPTTEIANAYALAAARAGKLAA